MRLDVGGIDPVLNEPFAKIAGRSRAMHKTQGFGNFGGGKGGKTESFSVLAGMPGTNDLFEGIDTTWKRVAGGAEIGALAERAIAQFNSQDPSASVPALLEIRRRLAGLPKSRLVDDKREQLDRILVACLGLAVETTIAHAEVVPGETVKMRHAATVRSNVPVRWTAVRYPSLAKEINKQSDLGPKQEEIREESQTLPADTRPSQPYWLRESHTEGLFKVPDPSLIGRPENPPAFPVEFVFEVGGQSLIVADEPVQIIAGKSATPSAGSHSAGHVELPSDVELFVPGAATV